MAIFNSNFYPTPEDLIRKLLEPYRVTGKYDWQDMFRINGNILEPSAGKGDIAKFIQDKTKSKVFCIELEPELQQILRADGFPVIHSDFLSYEKDMYFDFIIMNPPFDNGDLHLLKAIELSSNTKIACILNAETIKNPYSENRKRLAFFLKKYEAKIDFIENAFIDAERKTNVEVALIWFEIKKNDSFFEFNYVKDEEISNEFDFNFSQFEVQKNDIINNLKIRCEKTKIALIEKIKADAKFKYYWEQFADEGYQNEEDWILKNETPENIFSHFSIKSKVFMWNYVIKYLDVKRYMSSSMIKNYDAFISQQSMMSFNKENIFSFFSMVMGNQDNIIKEMIIDVFDNLTSYAHANILPVPKWKTNSAYKINKKIIAPAYVKYGDYCNADHLRKYGDAFKLGYSDWGRSNLSDLDKVLCVISGKSLNEITSISMALEDKFNLIGKVRTGDTFEKECHSTFFRIKFHKKGTIHLEFKDKELWDEFNYQACLGKNWIPDDEKRKDTPKKSDRTEKNSEILQLEFN
ncbi:DUF4942 domain-containing protein [Chryseobacterium antibioticum]|uniref:DUF4942 domain-containing protein n=1 Tax=Chryseobacterium pyrolae TaxID=2987481 RepID=A0ABT2IN17_9FLAO|nr:DUF4942 domain-containing protein [Chryseobacterium pyrolae]MCT2409979.1 DUF4942 domain-containing protein [Chryseobacterium pyrolae]